MTRSASIPTSLRSVHHWGSLLKKKIVLDSKIVQQILG